ncbi:MAG: hypothetical protein KFF73_15610 [Cyclobacteriaceae bacterium]|nr:hypothetical protein [Cyclobacteriaceae bacterium]
MNRNGNTADVLFSSSADYIFTNSGTVNISNFNLNADDITLEINGNAGINLTNDLDFQPNNTDIEVTNNNTSTLTLNRIFFNDDNCSFINNGTVVLNDALEVNSDNADQNNFVTNNGTLTIAADIDASNCDFFVYNNGTVSSNGFTAIDGTNGFYNYDGAFWNYGGARMYPMSDTGPLLMGAQELLRQP